MIFLSQPDEVNGEYLRVREDEGGPKLTGMGALPTPKQCAQIAAAVE